MSLIDLRRAASALALVALATGCAGTKQSIGINSVDDLVSRVERVHLEAELSKEAVYAAVLKMGGLFADSFDGDPAQEFETFAVATGTCSEREAALSRQAGPLDDAAESVFERWSENLAQFSSPKMRERSASRLQATRARYLEVSSAAQSAERAFGDLNRSLRDTVLFLGHDFNSFAVKEIEADAVAIRDQARALGGELDELMAACEAYVEKSALRGQAIEEVESETSEGRR